MTNSYDWKNFNKTQPLVGLILIVLLVAFAFNLEGKGNLLPIALLTGIGFGYVLTRSRYGFAGGVKRIYVTGEGSLTKSILVLLGLGALILSVVHWQYAENGAVLSHLKQAGDTIIPGSKNIKFTNINTIVGGFIFGIGMMMAGGCASGTLSDLGEGEGRSLIALVPFVLGAAPGHWAKEMIDQTEIGKIGTRVYLPDLFGNEGGARYIGALLLTAVLLLIIYWITRRYEDYRKKEGYYFVPEYDDIEKPLPIDKNKKFSFFSKESYHKFFVQRWNFMTGGVLLSVIAIIVVIANAENGRSWGVTSAFTTAGLWIFEHLGMTFDPEGPFAKILPKVHGGLLNDYGTISNIGVLAGACIAFLLAGRFVFNFKFSTKDALLFAVGGFFMGFGARMASGCNIGALFSSIINLSLSGWVFLVALTLGGMAGLKMFEGKVCIIPKNRHKK